MLFIKNKKMTIILINLKYFINIIARNQQKKNYLTVIRIFQKNNDTSYAMNFFVYFPE